MANKILSTFGQKINTLTLVPSSGGVFEINLDGDLLHSKKQSGSFPEENAIIELIRNTYC